MLANYSWLHCHYQYSLARMLYPYLVIKVLHGYQVAIQIKLWHARGQHRESSGNSYNETLEWGQPDLILCEKLLQVKQVVIHVPCNVCIGYSTSSQQGLPSKYIINYPSWSVDCNCCILYVTTGNRDRPIMPA